MKYQSGIRLSKILEISNTFKFSGLEDGFKTGYNLPFAIVRANAIEGAGKTLEMAILDFNRLSTKDEFIYNPSNKLFFAEKYDNKYPSYHLPIIVNDYSPEKRDFIARCSYNLMRKLFKLRSQISAKWYWCYENNCLDVEK